MRDAKLVIIMERGRLEVQGPIDDPLTCYALLEGARDTIFARAMENQRRVQGVSSSLPIEFRKPSS